MPPVISDPAPARAICIWSELRLDFLSPFCYCVCCSSSDVRYTYLVSVLSCVPSERRPALNAAPRTDFMVCWRLAGPPTIRWDRPSAGYFPQVASVPLCIGRDVLHGRPQGHLVQGESSGVCCLRKQQWCVYLQDAYGAYALFLKKKNKQSQSLRTVV